AHAASLLSCVCGDPGGEFRTGLRGSLSPVPAGMETVERRGALLSTACAGIAVAEASDLRLVPNRPQLLVEQLFVQSGDRATVRSDADRSEVVGVEVVDLVERPPVSPDAMSQTSGPAHIDRTSVEPGVQGMCADMTQQVDAGPGR